MQSGLVHSGRPAKRAAPGGGVGNDSAADGVRGGGCHPERGEGPARSGKNSSFARDDSRGSLAQRSQQAVQRRVALVQPLLHARVQHAVPLLRCVEERRVDDLVRPSPRSSNWRSRAITWPGIPSHSKVSTRPLLRRDLAEAALEAVHSLGRVLDEAPVAAALELQPLDHELVAAAPPLRDQVGLGERAPDAVARGVEDALDPDLAIARGGERSPAGGYGQWMRS